MSASRPEYNDLAALAAAHAALDPARQAWRCDILISGVLQLLASKGPLSERELHQNVKQLWSTNALDPAMLRDALARAENAGLVERRQHSRNVRWAATDSSIWDAKNDKKWAEKKLLRFEEDVEVRVNQLLDGQTVDASRARNLARHLFAALRAGSVNMFDAVARGSDPSTLVGLYFDHTAADTQLRERVNPKPVAEALVALARSAADPADEFGREIMQIIVTGQVLQGMVARRDLDLKEPPPVSGSLLLLDTSTLVYRLEAAPHPQLFDEFLQSSGEAGCRIVVTRAVIKEWESLWSAAEDGVQTLTNSATGLPSGSGRFVGNPVLRSWLSKADEGRGQTWPEFQRKHRKIENWLAAHDVQVLEDEQAVPELFELMRQELVRLSDTARWQRRTPVGARTDAHSAALVAAARKRNKTAVPNAWFIAQDQLTNKAYGAVQSSDRFPISSTVESWLLLLSVTRAYDPAKARDLAEIVGDSVILNSFIVVSANYGVDELVDMSTLLSNGPVQDPEDLAEIIRADYLALAAATGRDAAAELLRRRAIQRDRQAWRIAQEIDEARQEARLLRSTAEQADQLRADNERLKADNQRLRRVLSLSATEVVIAIGIVISALAGVSIWVLIGAAIGWGGSLFHGLRWLNDSRVSGRRLILEIAATISWTLLGSIIGVALSATPPPHSMHEPVPVTAWSAASGPIYVPYASFRAPKQVSGITGGGRGHIPRPQTTI